MDETAMKHDAIRKRLAEAGGRHWFAYETPQIRSLLADRDALARRLAEAGAVVRRVLDTADIGLWAQAVREARAFLAEREPGAAL